MIPIDFERILRTYPDPIVIAGPAGQLLWVNQALVNMVKLPAKTILDWKYRNAPVRNIGANREPIPIHMLAGQRAALEGQPIKGVLTGIIPPGANRIYWMECNAYPYFDDHNELLYVATFMVDKERRMKEFREVQRIRYGYRLLVETISNAIRNQNDTVTDERIQTLTPRQREVLRLVAEGLDNHQIGAQLTIKESTVRHHIAELEARLECANRVQLTRLALQSNLVSLYENFNIFPQIGGKDSRNGLD